jgi:hypothetical protein
VERTAGDIPRLASKSDRDARIHDAVRRYHYKLQEVGDHLGLHFSTVSAIAKLLEVENKDLTPGTCKSCKSLILFVSEVNHEREELELQSAEEILRNCDC